MKLLILSLMLLSVSYAAAYQGAVYNSSDDILLYTFDSQTLPELREGEYIKLVNYRGVVLNDTHVVQYKFETTTFPQLEVGEYIVLYDDINSVLKDAKYDGVSFINPKPAVQYEEIELKVEKDPIDPTQTIISGLAGAGAAYLMVRRKKAA